MCKPQHLPRLKLEVVWRSGCVTPWWLVRASILQHLNSAAPQTPSPSNQQGAPTVYYYFYEDFQL